MTRRPCSQCRLDQHALWSALLREALIEAWAQKIPSLLILLTAASTCATALGLLGHSAAQQRELAATLESAGGRIITITDTSSQGLLTPEARSLIQSLSGVESAVSLSPATDVVNVPIPGTPRVPAWEVDQPEIVTLLKEGRQEHPGEASTPPDVLELLRLSAPSGGVRSIDGLTRYTITALGEPTTAFQDLSSGIVVRGNETTDYRQIRILVTSPQDVRTVQAAALEIIGG